MNRGLLIISFLLLSLVSRAQTFGNEWIDYSQVHYKIKVVKDGMYRINYNVLAGIIPNLGSISSSSFALYHNGQQVPIYVSNTTSMGQNDYIDFYGRKNIGDVDSMLYKSSSSQPHIYYSMFNDTSIYYLTVRSIGGNLRFTPVVNNLTNPPAKENYFTYESRMVYTGQNTQGVYYRVGSDQLYKSTFETGEGYCDLNYFGTFNNASTHQFANLGYVIPTPGIYPGVASTFKTVYASNSPENHTVNIQLNNFYGIYAQSGSSFGYSLNKLTIPLQPGYLSGNTNTVTFSEQQNNTSLVENVVYMNELDYAHTFDFNGQNNFYFKLDADAVNKKYIEITNFNDNNRNPVLYDITNGLVINSTTQPGTSPIKFVLPPSASRRELCLISGDASSYNTVFSLAPITFENYTSNSYQSDYIIVADTSRADGGLYEDIDGNGENEVMDYARFRDINLNPGIGKYHVHVFDINQLYDQFGYGVRKSPLAIRNFIQYANTKWTTYKPQYVFLIGKGREYPDVKASGAAYTQCLIPTFGKPGSDNLFASTRSSDVPVVSIGRLAAENSQQVHDYLAKMKEYDEAQNVLTYASNQQIEPKLWQKNVLHFSGGTSFFEQQTFRTYLGTYESIVRDTLWGAHVITYSKNSNDPISQALAQVIESEIDSGVSLITFFGHSATGAFDFSIDEPEHYTNKGKYPVILSNGCFAGFIHDATQGYSERFVLEADKGAIAFMATSSLSVSSGLNNFSGNLYNNLAKKKYYNTFGACVRQTLTDLYSNSSYSSDDNTMMVAYEMTLHGDPALGLNQYPKPDYAIAADGSSVFFTPSTITPGLDSFKVNVVVTNLGKAIKDSISVSLQRTAYDPNTGNPVIFPLYKKYIPATYYMDTVTFTLPTRVSNVGYGENKFSPYVDADFHVDEMAEGNNGMLTPVTISIQSDDVIPIYPYEFAIDSDRVVTLKASTSNPFAALRTYNFEIDTTERFNSPFKQAGSVTQVGGVLHWTPGINYQDSVVYYWRVKKDTSSTWHNTSFVHINGQYGWNQSHVYQLLKDNYLNIKLDTNSRVYSFPPTTNNIQVLTGYANAAGGNLDYETMGWNYNNNNMYRFRMGGCNASTGFLAGITFAVIDNVTGLPWTSINVDGDNFGDTYGNAHCSNQASTQYGFDFATTGIHPAGSGSWSGLTWGQVIQNFINAIPCNAYVLIYSDNVVPYTQWDTTIVAALQSLGFQAQFFKTGTYTGPFVYFTQKCNSSYPSVFNNNQSFYQPVSANINFIGAWNRGQITSTIVGPAHSWNRMQWRRKAAENPTYDKDSVDIIGINNTGVSTVLQTTVINDNDIQAISAQQYPYLQLRLRTQDDTTRTPTQMSYWRILYQKPPEAAINPAAHFVFKDSINLGGTISLELGLENVTKIKMDSVLTKYILRDATGTNYTSYIRHSPLPGLDTLVLKYNSTITGNSFTGINKLLIEANPNNDQLEQFHFNNYAELNFHTTGDKINPLIDVTFDGQHIMNGDIVSAKPDILVTLKDDNKYLPLNDTSLFNVYLVYPNQTTPVRISFDNQVMKFYPADSSNLAKSNKAMIEYKPEFPEDGKYELLIKDKDRSGNHSSSESRFIDNTFYDYKTSFEVINKPMITNVLNYPNPFTSSTRFVFTVTGSEVPDFMMIQIMTIRGTVVKEIKKEELGPLHIGVNMTEYAWDGRDQYGSPLANGVYFYHVVTRLDNKKMDQMSMSYDKYFKKGFGKMVLIR